MNNPDPETLAAVAADFVWAVCSVGRPCLAVHEHDDRCTGEFPSGFQSVFDSMYGVAKHIEAEYGLDHAIWRLCAPHMWEIDVMKDGVVKSRYFVNYTPIERNRPGGFVIGEARQRSAAYREGA